jgi:hypothetical protein
MIRIKRLEPAERGNYKVKVTTDKPLTKTALKAAMAELEEKFPDGLEDVVERQLKVQMERLKALDALEDDEDDDEEETPRARRGREIPQDEEDDDEEEDDEEEEDEEEEESEDEEEESDEEEEDEEEESDTEAMEDEQAEVLRVSRKNNSIFIDNGNEEIELIADPDDEGLDLSGVKKGDTVIVSAEYDEDEEVWVLTAISGDSDEAEDEAEAISGQVYEVVKVQEKDEIFDLQDESGNKVKMWLGDGVDVQYDVVKKGVKVTIDAAQDDEGDWIITALEAPKPTRRTRTQAKPKPKPRTRRTTK